MNNRCNRSNMNCNNRTNTMCYNNGRMMCNQNQSMMQPNYMHSGCGCEKMMECEAPRMDCGCKKEMDCGCKKEMDCG